MFQELENLLQNFEGRQKIVLRLARKTLVDAIEFFLHSLELKKHA
jgi:hypothetical protein